MFLKWKTTSFLYEIEVWITFQCKVWIEFRFYWIAFKYIECNLNSTIFNSNSIQIWLKINGMQISGWYFQSLLVNMVLKKQT